MSIEGAWENSILYDWYNSVAVLANDNQEIVVIIASVMVLGGSALLLRGKQMATRKEWKKIVQTKINAAIVSGIEDAVTEGEITSTDAEDAYRKLAWFFKSPDFLPQKLTSDQRISPEEYEVIMKLLFDKYHSIPGVKPGEVDNVHTYGKNVVKGKFGDKVRRRV